MLLRDKPMWRCPDCNETIEPSLDICWNCGTSRDGDRDPDFKCADELAPSDTANLPQVDSEMFHCGTSPAPPPKIKLGLRRLFGIVAISVIIFAVVAWCSQPKTCDDFCRLGMAHLELGEYPEAVVDLTRAIELIEDEDNQSRLPVIYCARAVAYNNQDDYANSLRDVYQAIDLMASQRGLLGFHFVVSDASGNSILVSEETLASWHLVRANALIGLGEKEKAIPDLNIVLQSDPKNRGALDLLAIAEGRKQIQ